MTNMFMMDQRMTHRANNLKIFKGIIFPISVFMMYSENIFNFFVSAYFALFQQIALKHIFANRCKTWIFYPFICKNTIFRTIFSIFTWTIHKGFSASFTEKLFCSSIKRCLRFIKTCSRTIFRFIATRRNMFELCITHRACSLNEYFISPVFACSTTILKSFNPIFRNVNFFATRKTLNIRRFHYAFD
jgi:hypothetical protein